MQLRFAFSNQNLLNYLYTTTVTKLIQLSKDKILQEHPRLLLRLVSSFQETSRLPGSVQRINLRFAAESAWIWFSQCIFEKQARGFLVYFHRQRNEKRNKTRWPTSHGSRRTKR